MLYGRCEQLRARSPLSRLRFSNKVDSLYEDAVEELQQALSSDISAQVYIQAGYSDEAEHYSITHCPDGMPRLLYRAGSIAKRDDIKIRILTQAMAGTDTQSGMGMHDLATGSALTPAVLADRLIQQRSENMLKAKQQRQLQTSPALLISFSDG